MKLFLICILFLFVLHVALQKLQYNERQICMYVCILFLTRLTRKICSLKSIMTNFIPQETKILNSLEPSSINNKVNTMIREKNKTYQLYFKIKSNMLATKLETLQNLIYETLESCKSNYYETVSKNICRVVCSNKGSQAITPKYY